MELKLYKYQFKKREGLIIQNGLGWGEVAPLPGFSKETLEQAKQEIVAYFESGIPPLLPSVQWGLHCASVPYDPTPLSLPLCAYQKPFPKSTHLKLKLTHLSLQQALSLTSPYIGKYRLRLDCNRSWTLEQALTFSKYFSPDDIDYWEEPVQKFEDLVTFSEKTGFRVGVDESFREQLPIHEIPTLAAIIVKPMLSGRIPSTTCAPTILSSSHETSLGIFHLAKRADQHVPHGLHTFTKDLLVPPLRAERGRLIAAKHLINTEKLCLLHALR